VEYGRNTASTPSRIGVKVLFSPASADRGLGTLAFFTTTLSSDAWGKRGTRFATCGNLLSETFT